MQLTESYRPQTFDEVVRQDKIILRIRALAKRGRAAKGYSLSGQFGTGKTKFARLIAQEVASALVTNEVNAREVDMEYVQTMERKGDCVANGEDRRPLRIADVCDPMPNDATSRGRIRTGTGITPQGILSPQCLPFHHAAPWIQHASS